MFRSNGDVPLAAADKTRLKALASQVGGPACTLKVAVGGVPQPTALILIIPFVVVLSTETAALATSVGGR